MQSAPYTALAAARPNDPYLAWEVVAHQVRRAWVGEGALLWLAPSAYHGKPWLTGTGRAGELAGLVGDALAGPDGDAAAGLSLPPDCFALLSQEHRPHRLEHWTWWWTSTSPAAAADPAVVPIADDEPGLANLLAQSRSVYLRPGDPRAGGWYGLFVDGDLAACLAYERHHPQVPHLASVVVDAAHRRQGLGTRLCGTATSLLLAAGAPVVSLAMMTANTAAAALYRSLGFAPAGSFASGTMPGRRELAAEVGWAPGGAAA